MGQPANINCDPELMRELADYLEEINPYVQSFKMMRQLETEENVQAQGENRQPKPLLMVFEKPQRPMPQLEAKRYSVPTSSEVAAVFIMDETQESTMPRIAITNKSSNQRHNISILDKICDPLVCF